jgi:hypothetical protein
MKNAIVSIFVFSCICLSCSQEHVYKKPVTKQTVSKPKPNPMPPPDPYVCGGYWICFNEHRFSAVSLKGPGNANIFPGAYGAAASSSDKAFFAGGHEEGSIGFVIQDVNIFELYTGRWIHEKLWTARSYLTGASVGDKVLFAGGTNIHSINPVYGSAPLTYYDIVDIFDADDYTHSFSLLGAARAYMASASADGKAFFIGGKTATGYYSKIDVFDLVNDIWYEIEMPRPRGFSAAAVVGDKIYIAGGKNDSGNLTIIDVYDYVNESWFSLEAPHEHPICTIGVLDERIFIAGGDGMNNNSVDIYDVKANSWRSDELSDSRYYIATASANNKLIFLGGQFSPTGEFSSKVDVYDGSSENWWTTNLNEGVSGVAATTSAERCVFLGFLFDNGNSLTQTLMVINP